MYYFQGMIMSDKATKLEPSGNAGNSITQIVASLYAAYSLADTFCDTMLDYKTKGITYQDAMGLEEYARLEGTRETMMRNCHKATVAGSLAYLALHHGKMVSAQNYYHSGFGKPCPIKL